MINVNGLPVGTFMLIFMADKPNSKVKAKKNIYFIDKITNIIDFYTCTTWSHTFIYIKSIANYLPKTLSLDTVRLEIEFWHMNFGRT